MTFSKVAPVLHSSSSLALMLVVASLAAGRAQSAAGPPHQVKPVPAPRQDGVLLRAQLAEAGNLINVTQARLSYGVNGAGLTAAVLDTGIRATHNDFTGRVVAQQNYTSDNGGTLTNAADGNGHGTNVAGIIVANGTHTGMAPGAGVAALKVLDNSGGGSFTAISNALDWVIANRLTHNISVVNMSLGDGGNYTGLGADTISAKIATLRAAKVAVCVAAGNDFYGWSSVQGMAYPAIFGSTVSVGAVYDASIGGVSYGGGTDAIAYSTGPNRICPFSQRLHSNVSSANRTDILAPGAAITSSGLLGDTSSSTMHGTSQATPVVAGVILLLQQYYKQATGSLPTVDQLESWMRASAVTLVDGDDEDDNVTNTGLSFPRIDALAALNAAAGEVGATYSISGSVTVDGIGLPGVSVSAGATTVSTAANGAYTLSGLAAGSYTVQTTLAGYSFSPPTRTVTVGPSKTSIDFSATLLTYSVSGTVRQNGTGLIGVTVTDGARSTTTNEWGQYTLTNVPPGVHSVTPTLSGYTFNPTSTSVTVAAVNRTGIDFTATRTSFRIAGQITLGGVGVSGVTVSVGGNNVVTGAGGTYEVTDLPAGSYLVQPTSSNYTFVPNSRNVTIGPDQPAANFAATRIYQISGRITVSGVGVAGVTVSTGQRTATTDSNGDYLLTNLTPGSHTVIPTGQGYLYTPANRKVTITSNNVSDISFTGANPPSIQSITPKVTQLVGGKSTTLTVLFDQPLTANTTVTLASSDVKGKVPVRVVVKKKKKSAKVTLTTKVVAANLAVTITATSGGVSRTTIVTLLPKPPRR